MSYALNLNSNNFKDLEARLPPGEGLYSFVCVRLCTVRMYVVVSLKILVDN